MASEHQIQSAFFALAAKLSEITWYRDLRYMFAIPNGGARNIVTGAMLKREGVKKGVPDVFLPIPRGQHHGMFIEFKTPKGKVSKEQQEYLEYLADRGYYCVVSFGAAAALEAVKWYLDQDNDQ